MSSGAQDLWQRRNDPKYVNWLAVGDALMFLSDGLRKYAEIKMKELHGLIVKKVGGPGVKCTCKFKPGKKPNPHDSSTSCIWARELKKFYVSTMRGHEIRSIPWHHSISSQWHDPIFGYWEIAKLFMWNLGNNLSTTKDPSTTDCVGIMDLFKSCRHFNIQASLLDAIIYLRSVWARKRNHRISDSHKQTAFNDIKRLMNYPELVSSTEVQDCCPAIKRVEKADFAILQPDELRIVEESERIKEYEEGMVEECARKRAKLEKSEIHEAFNPQDWNKRSIKHREKFEKLIQVTKEKPESTVNINSNIVCFEEEFHIGEGSCGTEVYICLGYDGVERAIKRMPIRLCKKLLKNERDILCSPNVVNSPRIVNYWFYDDTSNPDFGYLILNLCESNLEEYIREEGASQAQVMIRQVLEGLQALHSKTPKILHRDLKPTNILVNVNGDLVLSDFGIGRFLPLDTTTCLTESASDAKDWTAYECIDWEGLFSLSQSSTVPKLKWQEKSEIQVAGMLAYYILTKGEHPFGPKINRLIHFYNNNLDSLEKLKDEVVKDLLYWMLDRTLENRPYVEQALKHQYFLSAKEQLELLEAVGNQPEIKMGDANCDVVQILNNLVPSQPRSPLLPTDWKAVMNPDDLNTCCLRGRSPSKYDGNHYTECLRFIRNTFQHWHDAPRPALKDMSVATSLEEYFLQLFPTLPLVLHQIIKTRPNWSTRSTLEKFFPQINLRPAS